MCQPNTPEFVSQVISRQYDGIIISSISFPEEYVRHFSKAGIPVLLFEHKKHDTLPENVATLASGLYSGARTGVNHSNQQRKKNIIYIDRISRRGMSAVRRIFVSADIWMNFTITAWRQAAIR